MNEIKPDLSDKSRCISVHWSLPVQCVLPPTHRENWHETWDPETGNRLRYRRSMGVFRTEALYDGTWHDLELPAPGAALTDTQLTEIEARANRHRLMEPLPADSHPDLVDLDRLIEKDVPALLADVKRLREENARLLSAAADAYGLPPADVLTIVREEEGQC